MTRTCIVCDRVFSTKTTSITCSPACQDKRRLTRNAASRLKRLGKPPQEYRPMDGIRNCSECGGEFSPKSPVQNTCSNDCYRKRHRRLQDIRLGRTYHPKPKPQPVEVTLMRKAGTAIVAEGLCRQCAEPIHRPAPGDSRLCTWCWVNSYMPAEERRVLRETSR